MVVRPHGIRPDLRHDADVDARGSLDSIMSQDITELVLTELPVGMAISIVQLLISIS